MDQKWGVTNMYVVERMRFFILALLVSFGSLQAGYLFKNGRFINEKNLAFLPIEVHYQKGIDALKNKAWEEAEQQFRIVTVSFEEASLAIEAHYYLGVALYEQDELDVANTSFTTYLQKSNSPAHLEDVYRYKLDIAQKLAAGHRRHLFGYQSLPNWMTGRTIALEIFDEVSSALPNHDLAAAALLAKGELQYDREEYAQAIETYQTAIRRFPGASFALRAYQGISTCYLAQVTRQPQNVDAMALAEINVKEFQREFPQASEGEALKKQYEAMCELYVAALYETGQLYERMSEPKASVLYYHLAVSKLPTSAVADACRERLKELSTYAEELHVSSNL